VKKHIYLDHASTTPIDNTVLKLMYEYDSEYFSNPSSIYPRGDRAREELQNQRKNLAQLLQARREEIIFTSGGTESNNLAILGVINAFVAKNSGIIPHVIISGIEHASVIDPIDQLYKDGKIERTLVHPKKNGIVRPLDFIEALTPNTVLVSLMLVNNEIGTIQQVGTLSRLVREYRTKNKSEYPYIHTDACQGGNYELVTAPRLGVDLLTINGSKVYGPKGVGALYIRNKTSICPVVFGGGQEKGLRSGTENLSGVIGLVESFRHAQGLREQEGERLRILQKHLFDELTKIFGEDCIWGDKAVRVPNNVSVHIPGISAEELVIRLGACGIEVSSKSACSSIDTDGSYVILELGGTQIQAQQTLRISMGRDTDMDDINHFLRTLLTIVKKYSNDI
jgi:cysteine desulfurase